MNAFFVVSVCFLGNAPLSADEKPVPDAQAIIEFLRNKVINKSIRADTEKIMPAIVAELRRRDESHKSAADIVQRHLPNC